jgi:preprotein translocase subunit SecE
VAKAEMSVAKMAAEGNNEPVVKPEGSGGSIGSWLEKAKEYYADLKSEMKKVTWPSREQVQATTAVVIACVFAFAAYFALVDVVLGKAISRVFDLLAK